MPAGTGDLCGGGVASGVPMAGPSPCLQDLRTRAGGDVVSGVPRARPRCACRGWGPGRGDGITSGVTRAGPSCSCGAGDPVLGGVTSRVPRAGPLHACSSLGPGRGAGSHLECPGRGPRGTCRAWGPGRGCIWHAQGGALLHLQGLGTQAGCGISSGVPRAGTKQCLHSPRLVCRGWGPESGAGSHLGCPGQGPHSAYRGLDLVGEEVTPGVPKAGPSPCLQGLGTRVEAKVVSGVSRAGPLLCLRGPRCARRSWGQGRGAWSLLGCPGRDPRCACGALAVPAGAGDLVGGRSRLGCTVRGSRFACRGWGPVWEGLAFLVPRVGPSPCLQGWEPKHGGGRDWVGKLGFYPLSETGRPRACPS